jgi:hypothetical protein
MKPDRERMPIILRRTERGLEPRSRLAADALAQYALHSDVEISIKKRRSAPQLRLYWAMLHNVVEATGAFPDAERLHEALKLDLGFVTPMKLLDGRTVYVPDSAAMSRMDAAEFRRFFDAVVKRLAEVCGFDPLAHEAAA